MKVWKYEKGRLREIEILMLGGKKMKLKQGIWIGKTEKNTVEVAVVRKGDKIEWRPEFGFSASRGSYWGWDGPYEFLEAVGIIKPLNVGELRRLKKHGI